MNRPLYRIGCAITLLGALCQPLQADTELAGTEVTASRTGQMAESLPVGTLILDAEAIERLPARNLADALDSLGGVTARRFFGINASRASLDLLGFGETASRNTLILLNGRRLNDLDLSATDLAAIPIAAIQRVEVLPGSGAVLHGSGASTGVINIVTREQYRTGGDLELSAGSFRTREARAHGAASDARSGAMASVQALDSDGWRDNNTVRQRNAFADVRHHQNRRTWSLTAQADDQELGLPGGRNPEQLENDRRGTDTPDDWAEQRGLHLMPGVVFHGDRADFHLEGSRRSKSREQFLAAEDSFQERELDRYSLNPRATGTLETGGIANSWTLGADYQVSRLAIREAESPDSGAPTTGERDLRQSRRALYLHNLTAVTDRTTLTLGARQEGLRIREEDARRDRFGLYEAGVNFRPVETLALFASGSRTARIPTAEELAASGDEPLETQTGELYTTGMRWGEGGERSALTLWYGRFRDEIIFVPDGPSGGNENLEDDTRRRGISLNSRFRLEEGLWFGGSITEQRATFTEGEFRGNSIPLVPERTATLQLDWQPRDNLTFSLAHRYNGKRHLARDLANDMTRLPSYNWTDLSATFRHRSVRLELAVFNLADNEAMDLGFANSDLTDWQGQPLPERHYMISLGVEL